MTRPTRQKMGVDTGRILCSALEESKQTQRTLDRVIKVLLVHAAKKEECGAQCVCVDIANTIAQRDLSR